MLIPPDLAVALRVCGLTESEPAMDREDRAPVAERSNPTPRHLDILGVSADIFLDHA